MLVGSSAFAGGGWPIPKGKGFFKLSQNAIRSDGFFTPSGDIVDIPTTSIYITSLYGEYGITDRFGVIAYAPFFSRATLNRQALPNGDELAPGDEVNSLGDFDLSVKYGLITNKPIVLSTTLTIGLPFGNDMGGETRLLQTGDGELNIMLSVEASRSFNNGKSYINTLVAFNNRSENFSDELRFGFEIGHRISDKFSGALKVLSVNSLNNGSDLETPVNGIFSNNIEFLAITPEVSYNLNEKYGVSASVGFAASGKRVLASPNYSLGIFLKI